MKGYLNGMHVCIEENIIYKLSLQTKVISYSYTFDQYQRSPKCRL